MKSARLWHTPLSDSRTFFLEQMAMSHRFIKKTKRKGSTVILYQCCLFLIPDYFLQIVILFLSATLPYFAIC